MSKLRTRLSNSTFDLLMHINVYAAMSYLLPNVLTVLNYHRIEDPNRMGFDTFKLNVSATPQDFARQMDYVKKSFNIITCERLAAYLRGEEKLPPRAAIITFDDGYNDNLQYAYPILRKRGLSAVIFLTTNFMSSDSPFYWDLVAYCFYHAKKDNAFLPLTGSCSWHDGPSRELIMLRWIEAAKKIPETEKRHAIEQIAEALKVAIPTQVFSNLYLTWNQVREMSQSGVIEFGSHTENHPILTRIPLEQAKREIEGSKKRIEEEIGKRVISLAYPNGGAADFSGDIIKATREAGIEVAFTLLSGPTRYITARQSPLAIRRIFLIHTDSFSRFVAKLHGAARLI